MRTIWVIVVQDQLLEAYEDTMKAQERYFELYNKYGSRVKRHQVGLK